jgi:asparagine N-glycosylation enzyme membrane subunit Stt3
MESEVRSFFNLLVLLCALFAVLFICFSFFGRIPMLGQLPGDVDVPLPGGSVYLPIGTSVVLGALLTGLAYLSTRMKKSKQE